MTQMGEKKRVLQSIQDETKGTNMTIEQYRLYESTITQKVYRQMNTSRHNTLCDVLNCYGNCHEGCDLDFSFDPKGLLDCWTFSGSKGTQACRGCGHSYEHHHHYNSRWELHENKQISIDLIAKKKHDDALSQKAQQESRMKRLNTSIADIDTSLEKSTAEVGQLTEDYAKLSLSGSFTGQVQKSVALLELNLETMRSDGTDAQAIKAVENVLAQMQKKLEIVEKAKEKERQKLSVGARIVNAITGN